MTRMGTNDPSGRRQGGVWDRSSQLAVHSWLQALRGLIVIHGGPDFDHCYLLPEMDRLADLKERSLSGR
jgi:hypothetical protein